MSDSNGGKSIIPNEAVKSEASKSGWLLKWTNYLKGNQGGARSDQPSCSKFSLQAIKRDGSYCQTESCLTTG